jgi:hypothetical protein
MGGGAYTWTIFCVSVIVINKYSNIIVLFVETPRKFITAKLSIRKPGSSPVLINIIIIISIYYYY